MFVFLSCYVVVRALGKVMVIVEGLTKILYYLWRLSKGQNK